jgi:hypothetical protein
LLGHSVTNPYHHQIYLDTLGWYLAPFLDGTRDRAALAALVLANKTLAIEKGGEEVPDEAERRAWTDQKSSWASETMMPAGPRT